MYKLQGRRAICALVVHGVCSGFRPRPGADATFPGLLLARLSFAIRECQGPESTGCSVDAIANNPLLPPGANPSRLRCAARNLLRGLPRRLSDSVGWGALLLASEQRVRISRILKEATSGIRRTREYRRHGTRRARMRSACTERDKTGIHGVFVRGRVGRGAVLKQKSAV